MRRATAKSASEATPDMPLTRSDDVTARFKSETSSTAGSLADSISKTKYRGLLTTRTTTVTPGLANSTESFPSA